MKKLLLILLSIFTIVNAEAKENVFERAEKRAALKQKRIEQFKEIKKLNSNVNVPTLLKFSNWDNMALVWNPFEAIKTNYSNNRIESEYHMSYDLMDTSYRLVYTYNGAGQISLLTYEGYDKSNATFIPIGKVTYTYANNGLRVVQVMEEKDSTGVNWVYSSRYINEMNDKGAYIEYGYDEYNSLTNTWTIQMKYKSSISYYQNTRKILSEIDSTYNSNTMNMEIEYKMLRGINSSGQIITISNYEYDAGVETYSEYDSIYYNAGGIPTDLIGYDPSNPPTLTPMMKLTNLDWNGSFNQNLDLFENEPIGYTVFIPAGQSWQLASRYSTSFPDNNGSNIRLEEIYENNAFVPNGRSTVLFDAHKNLILESDEYYNRNLSTWETRYGNKNLYTYDMNGNALELIEQYFNTMDSAYANYRKTEMSGYINITQGFNSNKNTLEAKLYPNPSTNGSVNINLKLEDASNLEIEVADVNGKIISTENLFREKGLNTITLNNLNQGMYMVSIKSEYGIFRSKLLVTGN